MIISFLNSSWGDQIVPKHRYYAFDKLSGEVVWVSAPGGRPLDTTYSTPVVKEIQGQRLLIGGNADGWIYAVKVRTGEKVWGFQLSKRGINSRWSWWGQGFMPLTAKRISTTRRWGAWSASTGRVPAISQRQTRSGDTTNVLRDIPHPAAHGGRVYFVDNSANIHCLDAGRVN